MVTSTTPVDKTVGVASPGAAAVTEGLAVNVNKPEVLVGWSVCDGGGVSVGAGGGVSVFTAALSVGVMEG